MERAKRLLIVTAAAAIAYAWFADSATRAETVAALVVACVTAVIFERTASSKLESWTISAACAGPFITRVLPAMFRESIDLLGPVLWRVFARGERVEGRWIELRYDATDRDEAREHGRRTIVIFGSNLTPNALPLDIDVDRGRLVLHQLVRRREAAASFPRYPM